MFPPGSKPLPTDIPQQIDLSQLEIPLPIENSETKSGDSQQDQTVTEDGIEERGSPTGLNIWIDLDNEDVQFFPSQPQSPSPEVSAPEPSKKLPIRINRGKSPRAI
jgi:hypothetical protein